jgi:wyosine [tRNA(Phe)-imidazoG37] synthetase (radical SAM superfamily)
MEIFGPVQSRRFGLSLGINHLPPKVCTYACVYCQLGATNALSDRLQAFSNPREIYNAVSERLTELDTPPDFLTFVSNGEPCLDSALGDAIRALKRFNIPIAVITNASLLWRPEIQENLLCADALSLKVDAVQEDVWHKINRPHGRLDLNTVLDGMRTFVEMYNGRLLTETMLVAKANTTPAHLQACAHFIAELQPEIAYLALPLRAPAEEWVQAPDHQTIMHALEIFMSIFPRTSLMADLPSAGLNGLHDPLQALLRTIKVHPMEKEEVQEYLRQNVLPEDSLETLLAQHQVLASDYRGKTFYCAAIQPKTAD